MFRKAERETQGIFEPNMTPLVDVSLVLVVILLVATPMALQSSITVQKAASASAQQAAEKARTERVEVMVVSPESLVVNRQHVGREQLRATVQPLLDASSMRAVAVRCGDSVAHGTMVGVLDDLKMAGAAQIAVQGR